MIPDNFFNLRKIVFDLLLKSNLLFNLLFDGHKVWLIWRIRPSIIGDFCAAHWASVVVFKPNIDAVLMEEMVAR